MQRAMRRYSPFLKRVRLHLKRTNAMGGGKTGPLPRSVGGDAPRRRFPPPRASARHGRCMTFLSRLSVRAILNAVTLALAAALCVSLSAPIGAAWRAVADADRLAPLPSARPGAFPAPAADPLKPRAGATANP